MNKMREEFDKWWDTQSTGEYWKPVEAAWGAWQAVIRLTPNNAPFAFAKPFSVLQRGLVMQHIAICNHDGHGYTIPIYTESPRAALSQPSAPVQQSVDAARYQRLRILGCAPMNTPQLDNGTVLRFQSLDEFLDNDLAIFASRGESTSPLLDKNDQAEVRDIVVPVVTASYLNECLSALEFYASKFRYGSTWDDTQSHVMNDKGKIARDTLAARPQPPQPDSNELVELRRDAERWRYCVSRGDFPKRPTQAATGQQSTGWLYKVSEFRVWFDSAEEAVNAAITACKVSNEGDGNE